MPEGCGSMGSPAHLALVSPLCPVYLGPHLAGLCFPEHICARGGAPADDVASDTGGPAGAHQPSSLPDPWHARSGRRQRSAFRPRTSCHPFRV